MPRIEFVALTGQHHYAGRRRMGKDVGNEREALVRAVGSRWQAEVDQCQRRCRLSFAQEIDRPGAGLGCGDGIVAAEKITQRVRDERVIVDNQQLCFAGWRSQGRSLDRMIRES